MMLARAIAVLLAIATLAGCSTVAPTKVTVTLGIYSGRPDPTWDLSDTRAAEVVGAISALPVVTGIPPQGGLGYHGFVLVLRRAGQSDATLVAFRGTVTPIGGGKSLRVLLQPLHAEELRNDRILELCPPLNVSTNAPGRVSQGLVRCHRTSPVKASPRRSPLAATQ